MLRVLRFVHFQVLVPLAVLGTVLTLGAWRRLWILHASSLAMAASVIAFFIFARYREPIDADPRPLCGEPASSARSTR
ncbi:MAG: hypothetical protein R3E12_14735 [Candidatus Eisenbacteria bacterium]